MHEFEFSMHKNEIFMTVVQIVIGFRAWVLLHKDNLLAFQRFVSGRVLLLLFFLIYMYNVNLLTALTWNGGFAQR